MLTLYLPIAAVTFLLGGASLAAAALARRIARPAAVRLALGGAAAPVALMAALLADLPHTAAAHGAGDGTVWPAAAAAAVGAGLVALGCLGVAAVAAGRRPRWVAFAALGAAAAPWVGRQLAVFGAPDEFYLVQDGHLWTLLFFAAVTAAIGAGALALRAEREPSRPRARAA